MIEVSTKRLVDAIEEARAFKLPGMSAGADYIYRNIYGRLTHGMGVRMGDIDFGAFELDDVDTMRDLYSNVLESNESKADSLAGTLRGLPPVIRASAFV